MGTSIVIIMLSCNIMKPLLKLITIKTVKSYPMNRIWMQSVDINTINVFVLVPPVIEGFVLFYLGGGGVINLRICLSLIKQGCFLDILLYCVSVRFS